MKRLVYSAEPLAAGNETDRPRQSVRPRFRFSDLWRAPLHDLPIREEILFRYLPLSADMDVLEVGPGTGFTAFRLSREVNSITLLDIAGGSVENLKRTLRGLSNVEFVHADVASPRFSEIAPARFDAIYGLDVFEYVAEPSAWLRGLGELMKPGGTLLLVWPNYSFARSKGVNHIRTAEAMEALLLEANLPQWELYALKLRPYARAILSTLHEAPVNLFRHLRGQPDARSAPTFDLTWTHQHGAGLARYRAAIHFVWMLESAALRLGGDCFSRRPITEGSADGYLMLLARR